jgi:hypothetical protein
MPRGEPVQFADAPERLAAAAGPALAADVSPDGRQLAVATRGRRPRPGDGEAAVHPDRT